ncbi:MAG TPA: hypothetical protein VJ123_08210 [Anaerolineales bacterium]|nr:hypothetical protein [Anaerolineales bacterium]
MSDKRRNEEVDRLARLRDQQLRARDPLTKQKRLDHSIAVKQRRARKRFSFSTFWSEVPHKWRGLLYGGLLGTALFIFLPRLMTGLWGTLAGLFALFFVTSLGFLIGRAADSRDELRELMKR